MDSGSWGVWRRLRRWEIRGLLDVAEPSKAFAIGWVCAKWCCRSGALLDRDSAEGHHRKSSRPDNRAQRSKMGLAGSIYFEEADGDATITNFRKRVPPPSPRVVQILFESVLSPSHRNRCR